MTARYSRIENNFNLFRFNILSSNNDRGSNEEVVDDLEVI